MSTGSASWYVGLTAACDIRIQFWSASVSWISLLVIQLITLFTLEGNESWHKYLDPCHLHGNPDWDPGCWLWQDADQDVAGIWRVNPTLFVFFSLRLLFYQTEIDCYIHDIKNSYHRSQNSKRTYLVKMNQENHFYLVKWERVFYNI